MNGCQFEKRKIALIGDKNLCRRFYLQFYSVLNIRYFFSADPDGTCLDINVFTENRERIKSVPFKENLIAEEDLLVVLCIDHMFRDEYDLMFYNKGYEWGRDYIDSLYMIQYYRQLYKVDLKEKKIWIFGAGNNGRLFYEYYKDIYDIQGFISNFEEEKECLNLPVIRPDDLSGKKDIFAVICSDAEDVMAERLCGLGLTGGKNYGFAELLPKKLFIAIGTCQISGVAEKLRENSFFDRQYNINIYFENIYEPCGEADNKRIKEYGKFCDVVLYNIVNIGSNEFRNIEPVINCFYEKAVKWCMPFYYFRGQLIQATNSVNDYAIKTYTGYRMWFRGDREMNRMVENGNTLAEIIDKITGEDYRSEKEILENFRKELKKIEIMDRFSSFPIKSFIEKNYRRILIFIDGTHFSYQLSWYLANIIAERLHINKVEIPDDASEGDGRKTSVMPVYPCVKKALKMNIKNEFQFYNIEKDMIEYLNIEDYIKKYVCYISGIRSVCKEVGTILQ